MAYPKKQPKDSNNNDTNTSRSPAAPGVAREAPPQVTSASGGAPRTTTTPTFTAPPRINRSAPKRNAPMPTAPMFTLPEAQKYLSDLQNTVKQIFDERMKSLPPEQAGSRFWQGYKQYPSEMAALVARRVFTNKMIGSGPVAQWMKQLDDWKR